MAKITKCPICGSRAIKQEYITEHEHFSMHTPIGGEHTSYPPRPNGSSCDSCGSIFKFNKGGKCDLCKGTGKTKTVTYQGMIEKWSREQTCDLCGGTGKVG